LQEIKPYIIKSLQFLPQLFPDLYHIISKLCIFQGRLSSCMMYPSFENDFSSMEENVISDLVKQTAMDDTWSLGYLIDEEKLTKQANALFIGKNESDLRSIFKGNGDKCDYLSTGLSEIKTMKCQVQRWWNIKNVGYPYFGLVKDIYKYISPGKRFIFEFSFTNNTVNQYKVDISDVTIRYKIPD